MLLTILKSKIHRAVVTQADLNYTGSITIDKTLMQAAAIYEYEKVLVVNINNGERFETYAIEGDADSGIICLNGACARLAQIGDKIIILSFLFMNKEAYINHSPIKIYVDDDNSILA